MYISNDSKQMALFDSPYSQSDRMVLRNGIRFYTSKCFSIPAPIVSNYYKYYKLFYWSASHIIESIEAGMIVKEDISFIVSYNKGLTRGNILNEVKKGNANTQYMLSFRAPYDDWNIDPIVLIQSSQSIQEKE